MYPYFLIKAPYLLDFEVEVIESSSLREKIFVSS